jgi:hypothetical protein|tara:strand:+ start:51 stop:416 length:366 start_codon:yes stop_codon:yes gene_type:complete
MKKLLVLLALVASPVIAQSPPVGIKPVMVQMQLFCADSFDFLMNVLAAEFKEYPVMMGYLKEEPTNSHTLIYFVNKEMTASSLVVSKRSKDREQACIIWSGKSPSGMAFSVNPNPMFADEL